MEMIRLDTSRVMGPMVNQSDAPFRALALKYGATCVYSQMLFADQIVEQEGYLEAVLPEADFSSFPAQLSRPLCIQIAGNDPTLLASACQVILEKYGGCIDAIDFNLGCPQDRAKEGMYGAFLLDKHLWPCVFECVSRMKNGLSKITGPHISIQLPILTYYSCLLQLFEEEYLYIAK